MARRSSRQFFLFDSFDRQGKSSTVTMTTRPRFQTFGDPGAVLISMVGGLTLDQVNRSKVEDLGMMSIEGMPARGTRSTITYQAGEVGNERPFNIVNEVWYSADLQAVMLSKHSDPRSGDVTYRLTGITRSDPPASVFEVPPDYTVTQTRGPAFAPAR